MNVDEIGAFDQHEYNQLFLTTVSVISDFDHCHCYIK